MLALMKLRRRKNRFRRKIELESYVYILHKEKIIRGNKDTHQITAADRGETRRTLITAWQAEGRT